MQPHAPINNSNQREPDSFSNPASQNGPPSAFNNLPKDVLTSLLEGKVDMALQQLSNNQKNKNKNILISFFKSFGRLIFIFKFTTPQHQPHKKSSRSSEKNSTVQIERKEKTTLSQESFNSKGSSKKDLSNKRSILKAFVDTYDQMIHTILKNIQQFPQKSSQVLSPYLSKMVKPVKDLVDAIKIKNEIFIKWSTPKIKKIINPIQIRYHKALKVASEANKKLNNAIDHLKNQLNQKVFIPMQHFIAPKLNHFQNRIQLGINQIMKFAPFPTLKNLFQKEKSIESINKTHFAKEDKNNLRQVFFNDKSNNIEEIKAQALILANQNKTIQKNVNVYKSSYSTSFLKSLSLVIEQMTKSMDRHNQTFQQFVARTTKNLKNQSAHYLRKVAQQPLINKLLSFVNAIPKIIEKKIENLKIVSDRAITMFLIPCKAIGNSFIKGLNKLGGMSYNQYKKMESVVEGIARGLAEIIVGFYSNILKRIIKKLVNFIVWLAKKIWTGIVFAWSIFLKGMRGLYYFVIAMPGLLKEFTIHLFGLARRWISWVFGKTA